MSLSKFEIFNFIATIIVCKIVETFKHLNFHPALNVHIYSLNNVQCLYGQY